MKTAYGHQENLYMKATENKKKQPTIAITQ